MLQHHLSMRRARFLGSVKASLSRLTGWFHIHLFLFIQAKTRNRVAKGSGEGHFMIFENDILQERLLIPTGATASSERFLKKIMCFQDITYVPGHVVIQCVSGLKPFLFRC